MPVLTDRARARLAAAAAKAGAIEEQQREEGLLVQLRAKRLMAATNGAAGTSRAVGEADGSDRHGVDVAEGGLVAVQS